MKKRKSQIINQIPTYIKNIDDWIFHPIKPETLEAVIYGTKVSKIKRDSSTSGYLYLNESSLDLLCYANKTENTIELINLRNIQRCTFDIKSENLRHNKSIKDDTALQIYIDNKSNDFVFNSRDELEKFCSGLVYLYQKYTMQNKIKSVHKNLQNLWLKYDKNFDKELNKTEINKFAKDLGISKKDIFILLDTNQDGKISKEEVIDYFKRNTGGHQYADHFNQYATLISKENKKVFSPKDLINFFKEIEKEDITELDAMELIINFKECLTENDKTKLIEDITKKAYDEKENKVNMDIINEIFNEYNKEKDELKQIQPYMKLRDFSYMLNSDSLLVFDKDKMLEEVPTDRPLCDYIINSTHNTYLTGHQLHGKSSAEMYGFAMFDGYRLVELDCYDGINDDILITHGYTLVTKLHLKDILSELKLTAFNESPFPVILSIENHCDLSHQNSMAEKCKRILQDLYMFPVDPIPEYLPTLKDLENKFIIKTSGKRVPSEKITQPIKRKEVNKFYNLLVKDIKKNDIIKKLYIKDDKKQEKINLFFNNSSVLYSQNHETNLKKYQTEEEIDESKIETVQNLELARGLHGTKFSYEKLDELKLQPWEFVTLKSTKLIEYASNPEKRKKMIELNTHCMMKAYPQSFDSSNYDCIKCWIQGCQCAALNIQALDDDFTLFDKVFFKQNNNHGYVLKPKKLLIDSLSFEEYEKPYYSLELKIYSLTNLVKLIDAANKFYETNEEIAKDGKLTFEIYTLGSDKEDKNPKYKFECDGGVIFTNIKNNRTVSFDVYEPDLGGLMIKFFMDDNMFARGCIPFIMLKEGFRKVPLFDNNCIEYSESCMVGMFNKKM
jgi:hypothetical protein